MCATLGLRLGSLNKALLYSDNWNLAVTVTQFGPGRWQQYSSLGDGGATGHGSLSPWMTVWSRASLPSELLMHVCMLSRFSHVQLFANLWTIACQALLSTGFSRQEYWSGLSCPPPRDFLVPGFELTSLMSPALASRFFITNATWEAPKLLMDSQNYDCGKSVQVSSVTQLCPTLCDAMNCSRPGFPAHHQLLVFT